MTEHSNDIAFDRFADDQRCAPIVMDPQYSQITIGVISHHCGRHWSLTGL